jgi:hypothetical protein
MGRTCEFQCTLDPGRASKPEAIANYMINLFVLNILTVPQRELSPPGTTFTLSIKSSNMVDKKRYTKIDPKQYVQYTGPTRRYPRVNPFEKKIVTGPAINSQPTADSQATTDTQKEQEAEKEQTADQQQKPADTEKD